MDNHILGIGITQEDDEFRLFLSFGGQDEAQQTVSIPSGDLERVVMSICQSAAQAHHLNQHLEGLEGAERDAEIASIFEHFAAGQN